jgi:hypothetical protein
MRGKKRSRDVARNGAVGCTHTGACRRHPELPHSEASAPGGVVSDLIVVLILLTAGCDALLNESYRISPGLVGVVVQFFI